MSRFTFNFYNDIRKPLKSGLYSIKVWLYDKAAKKGINFTIKKVAGVEVSCSKDDWINIWENKDRKNSFNEVIGETTVYGRKLEVQQQTYRTLNATLFQTMRLFYSLTISSTTDGKRKLTSLILK
jgi:hypothetical protein